MENSPPPQRLYRVKRFLCYLYFLISMCSLATIYAYLDHPYIYSHNDSMFSWPCAWKQRTVKRSRGLGESTVQMVADRTCHQCDGCNCRDIGQWQRNIRVLHCMVFLRCDQGLVLLSRKNPRFRQSNHLKLLFTFNRGFLQNRFYSSKTSSEA